MLVSIYIYVYILISINIYIYIIYIYIYIYIGVSHLLNVLIAVGLTRVTITHGWAHGPIWPPCGPHMGPI